MRGIALLAFTALLAGGAQALSKEECQEKESEFLAEFEGLKAVEVDKQGGPLACVSTNSTGSWVNCDAHRCISEALRVAGEYEEYFPSLCPPSEGLSSEETTAKLETLQHMTECNECVVHYTRFQRLQARLEAEKCFPTALSYSCDEDCVGSLDEYSRLSNEMLMGICRMHNPGGCGDMGGVTEGEIYDILNGMTTEMARVNAVVAMCAGDCEDHIAAWMAKWQPLVAEGCISSADLDLAKAGDLTLQSFTLLEQCGEECRDKISDLIKDYHHLHVSCPKGLVADHKGSLENSISSNQCKDEDAWGELSMQTLAKSFFALSILCLGSFFAYILGSMGYNRCVKGKRGWDCVPSLLCCCRPRSSQASQAKARRHRLEEEEEMVLYDSEDADDDHL